MVTFKRGQLELFRERIYRAFISGFQNKYGAYSEFDVDVILFSKYCASICSSLCTQFGLNFVGIRERIYVLLSSGFQNNIRSTHDHLDRA